MTEPRAGRTGDVVLLRRSIPAPPERVYRAWTDPALLARWMSPVGHSIVSVDPRPGGRFRVVMVGAERRIEHVGIYRELVPGRRLVFTWRSPYTGGDSVVTVELEPRLDGTDLTLRHEGLPQDQVGPHGGGWSAMLDRLDEILAGPSPTGEGEMR
jgi:uncharacterized protein YndB with AHSA1/START domain